MKHEIDLSKFSIHTDLAIDSVEQEDSKEGIKVTNKSYKDIRVTNVVVNKKGSKILGKKPGKYVTLEFSDVTDETNKSNVTNILVKELKKIIQLKNKNEHVLVVGLGNDKSTPDSLGPLTINQIIVTNHLYEMNLVDETFQKVSAFNPGVMGKTGIETSDILLKLVELLNPNMVIVIDALASSSISRVNKTIQITDTGIHPGSGIGNKRKEISEEILGIPVIAIGVPMVVDAVTIVSDTIDFLAQHYINTKNDININEKKNIRNEIPREEKENLLGLIGTLEENEIKLLVDDVLTPIGYNMMVTPKEIDFIVDELSNVLANCLNKIFHNR